MSSEDFVWGITTWTPRAEILIACGCAGRPRASLPQRRPSSVSTVCAGGGKRRTREGEESGPPCGFPNPREPHRCDPNLDRHTEIHTRTNDRVISTYANADRKLGRSHFVRHLIWASAPFSQLAPSRRTRCRLDACCVRARHAVPACCALPPWIASGLAATSIPSPSMRCH